MPSFSTHTSRRTHLGLVALSCFTLLVHGYHPLAEDGGLYIAGVKSLLHPALYPHDIDFVTAHRSYSLFAPVLATLVSLTHLSLPWVLLIAYVASLWLTLFAAWRIVRHCAPSAASALFAVALLAAAWTLPIAGTSLSLADPYLTARSFSTPLSLLAVSFLLESTHSHRRILFATVCLAAAALFHPLMAVYATGFVMLCICAQQPSLRRRIASFFTLALVAVASAAAIQIHATTDSPAAAAAAFSRYYWFLSQWQWFELLGLAGPVAVLALLARRTSQAGTTLGRASIMLACIATAIALLFAQEHYSAHAVARLQPLRAFHILYILMVLLLGVWLASLFAKLSNRRAGTQLAAAFLLALSVGMFLVQRQIYPASRHLELPWRAPANPWSQAFLWVREHTPPDARFALDAHYIGIEGEDTQTFRATAERSVLADWSKDGGEAAISPRLAERWQAESRAQADLNSLTDSQREQRLQQFHVTWMVLPAGTVTAHACPYDNGVVKVCSSSFRQAPLQRLP